MIPNPTEAFQPKRVNWTAPNSGEEADRRVSASVIITAHDRRQYLQDALDSVLAQDVEPSRYEIVVVKSFPDTEIDAALDKVRAKRILSPEQPVSSKVALGLRASAGEIVLLLDDDDLFERNKLRAVLEEFEADPTLGFYHNQVSYIGPGGQPFKKSQVRPFGQRRLGRAKRFLLSGVSKLDGLGRLAHSYPGFNSSSLAIRRELAMNRESYLTQLSGGVDAFFFFAALVSPYSLLIDGRRLTRYRIHDRNVSLAGGPSPDARRVRMLASAREQEHVNLVIRQMVVESGIDELLKEIDARMLITRLSIMFRDYKSGRFDAIRALIRGFGLRATLALRENLPSVAGAVLFAFSPRVARWAYEYQVGIRE